MSEFEFKPDLSYPDHPWIYDIGYNMDVWRKFRNNKAVEDYDLEKINAVNVPATIYIRFKSEKDITFFLLKYS